jgi:hypothetical protein
MEAQSSQLTKRLRRAKPIICYLKSLLKMQLESCAKAVIVSESSSTYRNNIHTEIDFTPILYTLCFKIKYLLIHSLRLRTNNE